MSLAENVTARQTLESTLEWITEHGEQPQRFWELLAEHCAAKLPAKPSPEVLEPMDYQESFRFEQSYMPFGKHEGIPIMSVPIGYLLRLTEDNAWLKQLRRYLASSNSQRRQDDLRFDPESSA